MSRARSLVASAAAAALVVPLSLGVSLTAAAAPDDDGTVVPIAPATALARPDGTAPSRIAPALREATGIVTAFVQLEAPSGVETADGGGDAADVAAAVAEVEQIAEDVVPADAGEPASVETPAKVAVTANVVPGVVVTGDAAEIAELAADPAVAAIHLVVPKTIENKGTDVFTRAAQAWTAAGATGAGVTIGVIDTGLDYTHATFGGPGTTEAYAQAYGTDGSGPIPDGLFDPTKFLGGYDFAGPTYDAGGSTEAELVPQPDENPIDAPHTAGGGHGSHVSGTAAGFGVTADGATFRGDYQSLTDISDWRVGPGSAPEAGIYALKVFGDVGGSTGIVVQALDWAADPNGDGDFTDHLDIINMSLGSDLSPADDPESLFVDELSALGVLTVTSAGNGGDVTDVGGSPGNATSALTVANSVGNTQTYDAVEVTAAADASLVGLHAAQNSVNYSGGTDVTAPVTYVGDVDGCVAAELAPFADEIAGTIVWLSWDDDDATRRCGSGVRWDNAESAGAVGVLIGTELPVFSAGIAGNAGIPGAQLTAAETDLLLPAIQAATAEAPVVVHLGPSLANAAFVTDPALGDTLNSGSSRGVHGSLGIVKPDVAAPGTLVSSAASGSGNDRVTYSGTSMSSPHVAGIAALVAQAHPGWSPQQIKAAVMNTASHDVYSGPGQTGAVYGPQRVGSGRVDALDAVQASTLAYDTQNPGLVSVTFGLVDVADSAVTLKRTVTVVNTSRRATTFTTSFDQATTAGGATISVSPGRVRVPARGSAKVTVTLRVDPATLARDIDPTQVDNYLGGIPREYVTTISGRLVLTPSSGPELRVPVQAAPRPVSALTSPAVAFTPEQTEAPLVVEGRGVAAGGWYSLMAPFGLVASSPELDAGGAATPPTAFRAADLQHIGFTSTAPEIAAAGGDPVGDGVMALGISTYGEWATLGGIIVPIIDTDVDGDGIWDFETYVWKYAADMDLTTVETYRLDFDPATGYSFGPMVDIWTANGIAAPLETSVFDSNVLVVPMGLAELGVEPGDTPTFAIATYSPYESTAGGIVDEVGPFTVDAYDPAVWFDSDPAVVENSLWYFGQPGADVTVHRRADSDTDLLVLHTHNDNQATPRAQVVDVVVAEAKAASTTEALAPRTVPRGLPVPVSALVRTDGPTPTGVVEVREGDRLLATARVVAVGRTGVALAIVRGLSTGNHELTVTYTGNDDVAPSSDTVTVRVAKGHGAGRV